MTEYKGTLPMGRRPEGEQALSGAERQARYRERHNANAVNRTPRPAKPRSLARPRRWYAAVNELLTLQAEYAAWSEALPESLREGAMAETLQDIVDLMLSVNAGAYSIEGANPRHAHEWEIWEQLRLPDGKILIPGVIDTVSTFIEHPRLVAQRLLRFAELVGRENVIAAPDCGFGTFAFRPARVHPEIMWAKFAALVEGARIASAQLWSR